MVKMPFPHSVLLLAANSNGQWGDMMRLLGAYSIGHAISRMFAEFGEPVPRH